MNWADHQPMPPLTFKLMKTYVAKMLEGLKHVRWEESFCGPFSIRTVERMIKKNLNCPQCGRKAKSHGPREAIEVLS